MTLLYSEIHYWHSIIIVFCTCTCQALAPSTHVASHHGSTNKKLRCHLPLKVPVWNSNREKVEDKSCDENKTDHGNCGESSDQLNKQLSKYCVSSHCWLRVADEVRQIKEGVAVVFDDSFEHEAANEHSDQPRVVLVVDFWHPDFDDEEVRT